MSCACCRAKGQPELGEQGCARLEAVSCDLQGAWGEVIGTRAPNALVCAEPFHVVKLAGEALDALRRQDWQRLRKEDPRAGRFGSRALASSCASGPRRSLPDSAP